MAKMSDNMKISKILSFFLHCYYLYIKKCIELLTSLKKYVLVQLSAEDLLNKTTIRHNLELMLSFNSNYN